MFPTFHNLFTGTSQGEFDLLRVRNASGQMVNVLSLGGGGGGSGGLVQSVVSPLHLTGGQLSVDLALYATNAGVQSLLQSYATTVALTNALAAYTETANLTIILSNYSTTAQMNAAIATAVGNASGLTLQLDGATQAATVLNFVGNNALLSGGVLNISRMSYQDKVVLRYSNAASDKDLSQGAIGQLV